MTVQCINCNKYFRDQYTLKRHYQRKIPCTFINKNDNNKNNDNNQNNDNSGNINIIINNNFNNNTVNTINNINLNLNPFKNEDLSHIQVEEIIDMWRKINKISTDAYVRAGLLISGLHDLIKQNEMNINVVLPNIRSDIIHVFTENGWKVQPTIEILDEVIKTRAGQLISFKDDINQTNNLVFKNKKNRETWLVEENFKEKGIEHRLGNIEGNKRVLQNIKVGILKSSKEK